MSKNLASNLRLRQDDKVKVVSLSSVDLKEARYGDLKLLQVRSAPVATSVTFSPIEDSLESLEAAEGGDEISDDELFARFIQPYTHGSSGGLLKQGMALQLADENGRKLDFMVTHIDVEESESESKKKKKETEGE
jgi:hypothetical protein